MFNVQSDVLKQNNKYSGLKQTIESQLKQFSIATGVNCMCISKDNGDYHCEKNCDFCTLASGITGKAVECDKHITYGAYQAERFDGKYIFYCPMGLVLFASPIFVEGRVFAVAVGGPVLLIEHDEYVSEDLIKKFGIDDTHIPKLKKEVKKISHLAPERVTALSEMLFAVCSCISGVDQLQYLGDEETVGNDVAKYINIISTMGGNEELSNTYPIEKERELLSLIAGGDKENSQRLLDEILHHIIAYSTDFEKAKTRVLELVVLLSRAALEGGADVEQIFGLNYKYLNQINSYMTVEQLSNWLSNIMDRFADCLFSIPDVKHTDTIYKAIEYIRQNYSKKITLEDVAGHVYLSPSYFSKIFKNEVDVSFSNYLNRLRVENSKRLLLNSDLSLSEVSEMLGFEDQSYFSKVFKKSTGVTPSKYRQRHGKI